VHKIKILLKIKSMNYKIITISIITFSIFVFTTNVQASVLCDFGSGFSVTYNNGTPTPTQSSCELEIINDEAGPLTITNLIINSTSTAFIDTGNNGDVWSCVYIQKTPAPDFTGETICIPKTTIILNSGESVAFDMNFSFESTYLSTQTIPDYVGLTDIVLNGINRNIVDAELGGFDWQIDAVDDIDPGPGPGSDPELELEGDKNNGKVRGYVYFDDNDNNKKDVDEEGVEGVKMKLQYAGPNDEFDTGDDERYTDKTNEEGKYRFDNLVSGAYRLNIKDGQMVEFYLTSEKDEINGKSHFSLEEDETKERDFGYDRDRDQHGNSKNDNLHYLQSGFYFTAQNVILYLKDIFL
jgi:hypothetical protein